LTPTGRGPKSTKAIMGSPKTKKKRKDRGHASVTIQAKKGQVQRKEYQKKKRRRGKEEILTFPVATRLGGGNRRKTLKC